MSKARQPRQRAKSNGAAPLSDASLDALSKVADVRGWLDRVQLELEDPHATSANLRHVTVEIERLWSALWNMSHERILIERFLVAMNTVCLEMVKGDDEAIDGDAMASMVRALVAVGDGLAVADALPMSALADACTAWRRRASDRAAAFAHAHAVLVVAGLRPPSPDTLDRYCKALERAKREADDHLERARAALAGARLALQRAKGTSTQLERERGDSSIP